MQTAVSSGQTKRRYIVRALLALACLTLLGGVGTAIVGAFTALQAEESLHATLFSIRLVEQFVSEKGRWPTSWEELEQLPFPGSAPSPLNGEMSVVRIGGSHGYDWPQQSSELRERVDIDFAAARHLIISQDPKTFAAIQPSGVCYEWRDYGFIESLQETLKTAVEKPLAPVENGTR